MKFVFVGKVSSYCAIILLSEITIVLLINHNFFILHLKVYSIIRVLLVNILCYKLLCIRNMTFNMKIF